MLLLWFGLALARQAEAEPSYLDALQAQAAQLHLADDPVWTSLLFYTPKNLVAPRSLITSDGFFLAAAGRRDPAAELQASLAAFFAPLANYPDRNQHPQCAHPARYRWLKEQLHFDGTRLAAADCSDLRGFVAKLGVERVSLVFSSFYLNNPSSMYGHTFLRLHRSTEHGKQPTAMLDYAINFAAAMDGPPPNFLLYAYQGLLGGYPGRYDVTRYYMKVQEYNNHDSRDLWEYELALNPEERLRLLESLWEFGAYHTDYYYFDFNCSYAILALVQAAKPGLDLLRSYPHAWVIPSDTVRQVKERGGLTGRLDYRRSSFSRYLTGLDSLQGNEDALLRPLLAVTSLQKGRILLAPLPPARQAAVLDTVLEFIDYDDKLAASTEGVEHPLERRVLLQLRAEVRVISPPLPEPSQAWRPDLGHGSTRHSLEQGSSKEFGPYTQFDWRPALHELEDSPVGYTPNLQLRFFDTVLRYEEPTKALYLKSWELIEILSLAPIRPLLTPISWHLAFGLEQDDACSAVPRCYRLRLQGGPGLTLASADNAFQFYVIPQLDVGYANDPRVGTHLGPALLTGLIWHTATPFSFVLTGAERLDYGRAERVKARSIEGVVAYAFSSAFDLRLKALRSDERSEVGLNLGYFW